MSRSPERARRVSGFGKSQIQVWTRKHNSEWLNWSSAQTTIKTLERIWHIPANPVAVPEGSWGSLRLPGKAAFVLLEISGSTHAHDVNFPLTFYQAPWWWGWGGGGGVLCFKTSWKCHLSCSQQLPVSPCRLAACIFLWHHQSSWLSLRMPQNQKPHKPQVFRSWLEQSGRTRFQW